MNNELYQQIDESIDTKKINCNQENKLDLTCAEAYALITLIKINKITNKIETIILIEKNHLNLKNTLDFLNNILNLINKFNSLIETYKNYKKNKNLQTYIYEQHANILCINSIKNL